MQTYASSSLPKSFATKGWRTSRAYFRMPPKFGLTNFSTQKTFITGHKFARLLRHAIYSNIATAKLMQDFVKL